VKSQVTTIKSQMNVKLDVLEFKQALKEQLFIGQSINAYPLSPDDQAAIQALAESKYGAWEWNYGCNPPAKIEIIRPHAHGRFEVRLELDRGRIKACRILDETLKICQIDEIERRLESVCYSTKEIQRAILGIDGGLAPGPLTKEEIALFIMGI
jgi:lipoate---protein ligase